MVYVASPAYLDGAPRLRRPSDLARHDCVAVVAARERVRWPVRGGGVDVEPRVRVTDYLLARRLVIDGAGVGLMPRFDVAAELARGDLVQVLARHTADVGTVSAVRPRDRFPSARVRAFRDLAQRRLASCL